MADRAVLDSAWHAVCVARWIAVVRREQGTPDWWPTQADVDHSALLERLLAGGEPLDAPPPGGCYRLIDRGYALSRAEDVTAWPSGVIGQGACVKAPDLAAALPFGAVAQLWWAGVWIVGARHAPGEYAVHYVHPHCAPGGWYLRWLPDELYGTRVFPGEPGRAPEPVRGAAWALVRGDAELAFARRDRSRAVWEQ